MDYALAVANALSEEERALIVSKFVRINPHWQGAKAADILDALSETDSNLEETDTFFDCNPDLIFRPGTGYAIRACIWVDCLSREKVLEIMDLIEMAHDAHL